MFKRAWGMTSYKFKMSVGTEAMVSLMTTQKIGSENLKEVQEPSLRWV